jgi:hypothetical protein
MPAIIYQYGCQLDKDTETATNDQFTKARHLYNNLVAIIRDARHTADNFIKSCSPEITQLSGKIDAANEAFSQAKADNNEEAMQLIVKQRKALWQTLAPLLTAARKEHKETLSQIYSVIGLKKECATYQARCQAVADGLGSTTADDIHATALKAWDTVRTKGGKLSFRSAKERQQDHIIVRFTCQGGVPIDDLLTGRHAMVPITPPTEGKFGEFKFRLGAAKAESYAIGTWQYHRPFPEGARVTVVRLVRKRIANTVRWYLQFQLGVDSYQTIDTDKRKPLAAIHLGFNLSDEGYRRIGAVIDSEDTGFAEFIDLPDNIPRDLYRAEQLQSLRDTNRDNLHAAIKALPAHNGWEDDVKAEWDNIKRLPAQHVSQERLRYLARKIGDDFDGLLGQFAHDDFWLYQQQRHTHVKTLARRKNFYRHLALDLVKRYDSIVVSRYDLKDMALRIKETGERNELGQIARHARHGAALYEFLSCLQWAGERANSVIIEHTDMKYVSHCAACGAEYQRDSDMLICECGHEADIKANSAANLFALKLPIIADERDEILTAKHAKNSKAAEKKADKLQRMQTKRSLLRTETQTSITL